MSLRAIAIIPARGGSKRLPNKNLQHLGGLSLLSWAILSAKQTRNITDIAVSSDDDDILFLANQSGAIAIKRPEEISKDDSLIKDAVDHALLLLGRERWDVVVQLYPSHPFRSSLITSECIQKCSYYNSVHTVMPTYQPDGTIVYKNVGNVLADRLHPVQGWGSYYYSLYEEIYCTDIDTQKDLDAAENNYFRFPKFQFPDSFYRDKPSYYQTVENGRIKLRPA